MLGTRLGPYRIVEELGSGGMGAVYRADVVDRTSVGLELGANVALKVIHPHLLGTDGFFKRFLREAEVGRRVQHECVVRTYDVDATVLDGRQVNYMVMEYVSGRSLRHVLADLGTVPDALLREIAVQAAAGLAAIHAQGIVHRDMKPENILLSDDERVRIMDLGVARLTEASIAITREGQFAGSVLFAAPEQLTGGDVGPHSDLYSLGVTLLELATGQNPFRREDAGAVIRAHLADVPRRAHDVNPDTSVFLSEVIATLAAKQPAERFASATALRDVLAEGERSSWWAEREKLLRRTDRHLPRISVRRDTALHARDAELAALRAAWSEAKAGTGRVILLEGEAGIGKTRLVDAFVTEVAVDDPHVIYGSYPPSGGLGGVSDGVIGKFGASAFEDSVRPYLRVTPALIPGFAALIRHEPPPVGSEPLGGDALHAVVCHLMRALADEKPTLWIVDDLHFATHESRALVLSMARAAGPHRVLLVLTARPGIAEDELANFGRLDEFRRVALTRLGAREVIELLRDAFRSETLAEKLGGKIAYKSDGVPYFVFEVIRGLKEGRFLEQTADGSVVQTRAISEIEVPSTVRDLIAGRLNGLSEFQRAILDVGAVQGISFDAGLVAAVLEEKKVRVLRELAEVERRLGVVRGESGACRFDQSQIQEVLYERLMPDLRSEYHALLADAYAEREELDAAKATGDQALLLATHHLRGSRPKAAAPCLTAALDHLQRQHRVEALLDLATRALDARGVVAAAARPKILLRTASAMGELGRHDDTRRALDAAGAEARALGDVVVAVEVAIRSGGYLGRRAKPAEAEALLRGALTEAATIGDRRLLATALVTMGHLFWPIGRLAEARDAFESATAHATEAGATDLARRAESGLAIALHLLGDRAEERECRERLLRAARELGDRKAECGALVNLGETHRAFGEYGGALASYRRCLEVAREIGERGSETVTLINLSETFATLGDLPASGACARDGGAVASEMDARVELVWVDRAEGDLVRLGGDLAGAEKRRLRTLQLARDASLSYVEAELLVRLAETRIAAGRRNEAADALSSAAAIAARIGLPNESALAAAYRALLGAVDLATAVETVRSLGERPWVPARMEAEFVLWKAGAGEEHLAEAKRLLGHLREHAPPSHRESLVANVPLHREIAAAPGSR
jgi:serine/threonine protein kinase/tetratricopeptide (TPR) repeat protein